MNEALKRLVWYRAENTCEYCRLPQWLDVLPYQIDHVIAEQHHGPTAAENLALSCRTAIGPTTIDVLGMNARERVEQRRLLIQAGLFPGVRPTR